jgi:hypothetical protein
MNLKNTVSIVLVALSGCAVALAASETALKPRFDLVPGVVIDHSPASWAFTSVRPAMRGAGTRVEFPRATDGAELVQE